MADQATEERTINYHEGVNPHANKPYLFGETNPGFSADADDRFQIFYGLPVLKDKDYSAEDKICESLYGCKFVDWVDSAGKNVSYRVIYKKFFGKLGEILEDTHKNMQSAMDAYRVGRTSNTPTKKRLAEVGSKMNERASAMGMSLDEYQAKLDAFEKDMLKGSKK
ncbi:MAG: hypothetical protein GY864_08900 [Desulfobacterales bacterium]|nr:hypothetical protein [Desulfobacterales bacterium]